MFDLTGKTALVTGSTQGIGFAIAECLSEHGAKVFVHGASNMEKCKKASEKIVNAIPVCADFLKSDDIEDLYKKTGDVDILVLNASIQFKRKWDEFTFEEYDIQMNCNLKSSYLLIKKYSAEGTSYPEAVSRALTESLDEKAGEIVSSPNNTLAIEYIRHLSDNIGLLPVKRQGASHDSDTAKEGIASASMIRKLNFGSESFNFIPDNLVPLYKDADKYSLSYCERAVLSSLRSMAKEEFSLYVSDTNGLDMRIFDSVSSADSLENLYAAAKSKNYTHSRVRREVMNLYLKVKREYSEGIPPYIKILAVSEKGLSLLSSAKNNSAMPIITKHSEAKKLSGKALEIYEAECRNTDLFSLCCEKIKECSLEKKHSVIIVK